MNFSADMHGQMNQPLTYEETCDKLGHYFTVLNLSAIISNIKSFLCDDDIKDDVKLVRLQL